MQRVSKTPSVRRFCKASRAGLRDRLASGAIFPLKDNVRALELLTGDERISELGPVLLVPPRTVRLRILEPLEPILAGGIAALERCGRIVRIPLLGNLRVPLDGGEIVFEREPIPAPGA